MRVIGDLSAFNKNLRAAISRAESATAMNDRFHLTVAANYGGRWDILQATRKMLDQQPQLAQPGVPIAEELLIQRKAHSAFLPTHGTVSTA